MAEEVIIKCWKGSNGALAYSVFIDPKDVEGLDENEDDGGECTAGMHLEKCELGEDCEGCPEAMDRPHTPENWKDALEMAASQAVELLARMADDERRRAV